MTRERRDSDIPAHAGNAALAAWMQASNSAGDAKGTCAVTRPVLGSKMSPDREGAPWTALPPIQWGTVMVAAVGFGLADMYTK